MYTVIGATRTRSFRVMWMLEELGEDYTHVPAAPRSNEAKRYNPSGKIPALQEGDTILTDSVAIMTYLADKHGRLTAPAGTVERARQDAMTFWLIDEMDAILWSFAKHSFALPEEERLTPALQGLKTEFSRAAATLSNRLDGPFLMGSQLTVPDILAVHCINWSIGAGFPRIDDKLFRWAKSLRDRPAFNAAQSKTPPAS